MIKGTYDNAGNVTISFNTQIDRLEAPGGKHYLPCDICGIIESVSPRVVAFVCNKCGKKLGLEIDPELKAA